jgi:hypothetical protein
MGSERGKKVNGLLQNYGDIGFARLVTSPSMVTKLGGEARQMSQNT